MTFSLLAFFALPESLSEERQIEAREKHAADQEQLKERLQQTKDASPKSYLIQSRIISAFSFLRPLAMFLPRKADDAREGVHIVRDTSTNRREWSLTLLAASYAIYSSMMAIYSTKMLYSQYRFGWGPLEVRENLGSVLGLLLSCILHRWAIS